MPGTDDAISAAAVTAITASATSAAASDGSATAASIIAGPSLVQPPAAPVPAPRPVDAVQADIANFKAARASLSTRKQALAAEEAAQHTLGQSLAAELRAAVAALSANAIADAEALEKTIAADAQATEGWFANAVKTVEAAL